MTTTVNDENIIDDQLYNRQRYVLGDDAMKRLRKHHVLLYGAGGVGIEIAKNIILAGVHSLTLQDPKLTTIIDLGTQYFLNEQSIGKNRAECSVEKLRALNDYVKCIVLTECNLEEMIQINEFCRTSNIIFITADVYGIYSRCFVDCGQETFICTDKDGEQAKEVFINHISPDGVVKMPGDERHPFQDNDIVYLRELVGLEKLNNSERTVKELNHREFSIGDISNMGEYKSGGIAREVKQQIKLTYNSLAEQLHNPRILTVDGSDYWTNEIDGDVPNTVYIHILMVALSEYLQLHHQLPECNSTNSCKDAVVMMDLAQKHMKQILKNQVHDEQRFKDLFKYLIYTARGSLASLCSAMGGFVGQQVLTTLTGKFHPVKQFLYLDAYELVKEIPLEKEYEYIEKESFKPDRYHALRLCIGETLVNCLAHQRLFMVGCGAIGCELLKLFALLGVGRQQMITITDHDHIEKSNLNRQFLFHKQHLNQPKSTVAAQSAYDMNKELKIKSYTEKVGANAKEQLCTDSFISNQTIIVNALDNVEARRYMDSLCVKNQRPLLESGTMGSKGHTFIVVPFESESYSSQNDPIEKDIPYCNVKSFPANIEHCTIWAREKFDSAFHFKPSLFNNVLLESNIAKRIKDGNTIQDLPKVIKFMKRRCTSWKECLELARQKFEKYYSHKALDLLHKFPLDLKDDKGGIAKDSYWKLPKRAPKPIEFDFNNQLHYDFVIACAKLYSIIYSLSSNECSNHDIEANKAILRTVNVQKWEPRNKEIITDPTVVKPVITSSNESEVSEAEWKTAEERSGNLKAHPLPFEKDDDFQIDFISAAVNLRAQMYDLEPGDRYEIKRIAGKIVPAIGTTTATVSGLISIELIKICLKQINQNLPLSTFRNFYINIALPLFIASEPLACTIQKIGKFDVSIWSNFEIKGNSSMTIEDFIGEVKSKYDLNASMITEGNKPVYIPWDKSKASKQLKRKMNDVLTHKPDVSYSELIVLTDDSNMDVDFNETQTIPPIRYYFST
ncbi:unnamed protein product [Didymodactylos carnosus]|uniref:Ubiquitin-activating enzyme E1 C-terminal domain-containing protein n=1 Tax=Didymodactylos carnosus TaxID=1234261 RepID=A0A8S2EGV7_9BILA|nr:unnamed protein product [Didymodactylos carnosus]CAF4030965.1 unnamed protein product [Didymodactylos carnosus]